MSSGSKIAVVGLLFIVMVVCFILGNREQRSASLECFPPTEHESLSITVVRTQAGKLSVVACATTPREPPKKMSHVVT
jgi:hypothetical protein